MAKSSGNGGKQKRRQRASGRRQDPRGGGATRARGAARPSTALRRRHRHDVQGLDDGVVPGRQGARRRARTSWLILIDDAGFGAWSTFGGPIPTPTSTASPRRPALHALPHHGALLADAGGAAHRPQPPQLPPPASSPSSATASPATPASSARTARRRRDRCGRTATHRLVRQEPQHRPTGRPARRAVRSLADGPGLRLLLRLHGRRHRPVAPALVREHHARSSRAARPRGGLHLDRGPGRSRRSSGSAQQQVGRPRQAVLPLLRHRRRTPRTSRRRSGSTKFKGQFDKGWDEYREETLRAADEAGRVPPDTKLTPRPEEIPAWDSLSADQKTVVARHDGGVRRFHWRRPTTRWAGCSRRSTRSARLDNTLVFYIDRRQRRLAEGGLDGLLNEMSLLQRRARGRSRMLLSKHRRARRAEALTTTIPVGWAWAMNTPFQWTKQIASHFGGTRNPLVVSWPRGSRTRAACARSSTTSSTSRRRSSRRSASRSPRWSTAWRRSRSRASAWSTRSTTRSATATRQTQYFEMFGNRAIYHDGWVAACCHGRLPWSAAAPSTSTRTPWELYNLDRRLQRGQPTSRPRSRRSSSSCRTCSGGGGQVQRAAARRSVQERANPPMRPSLIAGRTEFTYYAGHLPRRGELRAQHQEPVALDHRGRRHAGGRRRRRDGRGGGHRRRLVALREGPQAGLRVQLLHGRSLRGSPARRRCRSARCTITHGIRLRRRRHRQGRHRHALRQRQGGRQRPGRQDRVRALLGGRDLRHRLRHRVPVSSDYKSPFRFTGTIKKVDIKLEDDR